VRQEEFYVVVRLWTPVPGLDCEWLNPLALFVEEPATGNIVNERPSVTGKNYFLTKSKVFNCGVRAEADPDPTSNQPREGHDLNGQLVHESALAFEEFGHNIKGEKSCSADSDYEE